jgi:endo-1,4-beta-xylanase
MMRWIVVIVFVMVAGSCKRDVQDLIDCQEVSLHSIASYKVGVAVEPEKLFRGGSYQQKTLLHFNSITPESTFKMHLLRPSEMYYHWPEADALLAFAEKQKLHFHGHTLIWGEHLPPWLEAYTGDFTLLMKEYIETVVSRYKGRIPAWDVVNEAFDDDGNLKENIWKQKIGPNYVSLAFQYARAADPGALLFYNDYNMESRSKKLNAITSMLRDFKAANVPIDGIGLQMHVSHNYPTDRQIIGAINAAAQTGLLVHISEMDVTVNSNNNVSKPHFNLMKEQKKRVETIVKAFNGVAAGQRYGITVWAVSDADSWLRAQKNGLDWPVLLDDNYEIKPAFCGFINGIN